MHKWYYSITTQELYHQNYTNLEKFFGIDNDVLPLIDVDSKESYTELRIDAIAITLQNN